MGRRCETLGGTPLRPPTFLADTSASDRKISSDVVVVVKLMKVWAFTPEPRPIFVGCSLELNSVFSQRPLPSLIARHRTGGIINEPVRVFSEYYSHSPIRKDLPSQYILTPSPPSKTNRIDSPFALGEILRPCGSACIRVYSFVEISH